MEQDPKMSEIHYRHEIKHEITRSDLIAIRQGLRAVAKADPHAEGGRYHIRSLYFDNLYDKALREKIDGVDMREKFRIRFYNLDPSLIHLEKKSKRNGLGTKYSCTLSAEEAEEGPAPEAEPGTDGEDPDEDGESGFLSASDRMVRAAVRALKPVIARLPEKERASAADAALRAMRSLPKGEKPPRSAYAALAGAARTGDPADLGKRIISSRNINYRR